MARAFWFNLRLYWLLVELSCLSLCAANKYGREDRFLYANDWTNNNAVREHTGEEIHQTGRNRPDFLYNSQTYRIVNYYMDFCDTCRKLVPDYIAFARRMQVLATAHNVTIETHAVSCMAHRNLCRSQNLPGYPIIRLLKPGHATGMELPIRQLHPSKVLEYFELGGDDAAERSDDRPAAQAAESLLDRVSNLFVTKPSSYQPIFPQDLLQNCHLSLDHVLRSGVFVSNEPLTDLQHRSLLKFLQLLDQTLPLSFKSIRDLVQEIVPNARYAFKNEDYLNSYLDRHPPASNQWSQHCSKGSIHAGLSCGLWQLFHVITVGTVQYNEWSTSPLDLEQVAQIIRNFVQFFPCQECRDHFIHDFDRCAHRRCHRLANATDWKQLPLWLYDTHVAVTMRLVQESAVGQPSTVQKELAAVWPPRHVCGKCWKNVQQYDDTAMMEFLQLEYGDRSDEMARRQQLGPSNISPSKVVVSLEGRVGGVLALIGFVLGVLVSTSRRRESQKGKQC